MLDSQEEYGHVLDESLKKAMQLLSDNNYDKAIEELDFGILLIDEKNGINSSTPKQRSNIRDLDKNRALTFWLLRLRAEIDRLHVVENVALAESTRDSIDNSIKKLEDALEDYKYENRLLLHHKLYLHYEKIHLALSVRGLVDDSRRLHYHKLVAKTRFRFDQILSRPGPFAKIQAFLHWGLLKFLWITSDFGESPIKFGFSIITLLSGFALFLLLMNDFVCGDNMATWERIGYSFYVSMLAFFNLDSAHELLNGFLAKLVALIEYIFGLTFFGILVAMITKRIIE